MLGLGQKTEELQLCGCSLCEYHNSYTLKEKIQINKISIFMEFIKK
jgi:hypothetical protein